MIARRHDVKGRSTGQRVGRDRRVNGPPSDERGWVWITRDMLESPAWRALSGNARSVIERVMVEHMAHGGAQNGALPVTYEDLVAWGVRRNSIPTAIAEAVALGWLDHQRGRRAAGDAKGVPQTFTLTWLRTWENEPATNRWKRFKDRHSARAAADAAKAKSIDAKHNHRRTSPAKI